jgi:hypothetical protein
MREIQGTYENCKNSLIWQQGKKDTMAGHMENTLKTNWEHMGKYLCERSTNITLLWTYGEVCVRERQKETGGERQRETLE